MGKSDLRILIGADASNFNKNIKAAQTQLVNFGNVAKSVGSSIKTALVGAFAIDSAQRFFSTMIDAGRGFEDQMARVKAISNANTKQFQMMRNEAARLGETTKYSARQAAAALENLTRNGLSASKATKALSSVLELAGANAIELAEAADIVTNTMNMFEISIEDLNRVNDVLSKTTASSATNLTDLYEALKYAAPTANLFGVQIEEVNAALGVLANQGIKGSQAGTALRNVFNSLVKPSRQAKDILAKLGIDEVSIKLDGLLKTLEKFQGLSISDLTKVFGKEFGGITAALINSDDLTAALKQSLDDSMGEAARMFEQGAGSFNKSIDNFKSAFEGTMIKIFDAIKPALTGAIDAGTDFIAAISDIPTVLTTVGAALVGFGGKSVAKFVGDLQKEQKNLEFTREGYREAIESFSKLDLSLDLGSEVIPAKNLSEQAYELKKLQKRANDVGLSFDFLNEAIKATDNSSLQGIYNQLEKIQRLANEVEVPFRALESLMFDSSADIAHTINQIDRELKELEDTSDNPNTKKYFKDLRQELRGFKKEMLDTGAVTKYRAALSNLEDGLESLPQRTTIVRAGINKLTQVFRSGASAIISFFGGWATIGITAAIAGITALVSGWRKMDAAVREVNKSINSTKIENAKLNNSFKATVNELAKLEKGSIAWNTRMNYLKQNYPELTEELRLNEIYVNSSSEAYKNLADSMQRVIDKQSKINLADAAVAARDKLNETYANNDFGWLSPDTQLKTLEKHLLKQSDSELDKVKVQGFISELMSVLASTMNDKQSEIARIAKAIKEAFPKNLYSDTIVSTLLKDYNNRVGKDIKELDQYLNHETHQGVTSDDISIYVYKALNRLNEYIASAKADAKTKFTDDKGNVDYAKVDEYVASETQSFANQLLDEILNKFKGIKIEGKDFREFLKIDANFNEIANAARSNQTTNVDDSAEFGKEIEEAKKEYIKELYAIAEEYHRGYIDEEEFQQRKLDALNSLINVYRQHGDILGKEYAHYQASLFELNKVINDRTAAEKRAAEKAEKQAQLDIDRRDTGRDFNAIMSSPFEMETFFDSTQLLEARLGHLKGQLEDLKSLRQSIADMDGLADMTTELDSAIAKLTTHVGELAEKFRQVQLDDFKKEIKSMRQDLEIASYDTFVGFNQGIVSIIDACRTLGKLGDSDMDGWERFVTGFQAVISITDTLVSTAESIRSFTQMIAEFGKQKEILSAAESGANLMDVGAIEAEAAAVVAAESTKIGAIEAKAAANIATKMAEMKAAEALMAAESAAAYAGIPFAGVGLAAAQIAELKALIAASAAFANGGIVGGTSFSGDNVIARVNSGEMILNQRQQKNLFSLINSGSVGGGSNQVEFKVKGSELVGVLNNYNGRINKLR